MFVTAISAQAFECNADRATEQVAAGDQSINSASLVHGDAYAYCYGSGLVGRSLPHYRAVVRLGLRPGACRLPQGWHDEMVRHSHRGGRGRLFGAWDGGAQARCMSTPCLR